MNGLIDTFLRPPCSHGILTLKRVYNWDVFEANTASEVQMNRSWESLK